MKKYFYGFKLYFLNSFNYRFNTIIEIIFGNISLVVTILFWKIIYQAGSTGQINNYTLKDMTTYFIIGILFRSFVLTDSGFYLSSMIKQGGLNGILLKPYNFSLNNYFSHLATGITDLLPKIFVFAIFLPALFKYITLDISLINILFLVMFLVISSISSHIIWSVIGYIAFWFEEAEAVMWSFAVLFNFLSGMFIPLDFFPEWSLGIIEYLPIATWGHIPSKIFINLYTSEEMIHIMSVNIVAIAFLLCVEKIVWNKGIKRYSSIGG